MIVRFNLKITTAIDEVKLMNSFSSLYSEYELDVNQLQGHC